MKNLMRLAMLSATGTIFAIGAALADDPLMGKSPWNFSYQNRAAVAVAIKNIEDPGTGGNGAGTIVCGGTSGSSGEGANGSAASAIANSSCIIISNSPGATVKNDQTSDGDQTADSSVTTNSKKKKKKAPKSGSIDEVSAVLNGQKQGL